MAAPPHFPPPPAEKGRADGGEGPYRAAGAADELEAPRARSIGKDDVEWVGPDPQVARMIAATAGMRARRRDPWVGRVASALAIVLAWGLRGWVGAGAWLLVVAVLLVVLVVEVRRAWRASDVER